MAGGRELSGSFRGKRVGGAVYAHADAVSLLPPNEREKVAAAVSLAPDAPWNVAKVERNAVSLLLYEDFEDYPFPALLKSMRATLDPPGVKGTDWTRRANPPILHRKEMLLPLDDPRREGFAALTRLAEEAGLFADPRRIGTRAAWQRAMDEAGVALEGDRIVRKDAGASAGNSVARHKTAIVRTTLSQPMQLMIRHGLLTRDRTVFDYGCGQGDDLAALAQGGYEASGWDPYYAPDAPLRQAEVVNLGFVLNVIEEPAERLETLRRAWSCASSVMAVAVMVAGRYDVSGQRPWRDGFLTARGTFQRYFAQHEARTLIEEALGEPPVALAPGVFAVFRDKEEEQEFLLARRSRQRAAVAIPRPPRREAPVSPGLAERLAGELDRIADAAMRLGRMPDPQELPEDLLARLEEKNVSPRRAVNLCTSDRIDHETLEAAARERREDLLLHFALTAFSGRKPYSSLPRPMQRDVRAFFGSHAAAIDEAQRFLFSLGDRDALVAACRMAALNKLGTFREDDARFRFLATMLGELPAPLRGYVGCAEVLFGAADAADVIDLRPLRARVTFSTYDNASGRAPNLLERVHVDLARLRVTPLSAVNISKKVMDEEIQLLLKEKLEVENS